MNKNEVYLSLYIIDELSTFGILTHLRQEAYSVASGLHRSGVRRSVSRILGHSRFSPDPCQLFLLCFFFMYFGTLFKFKVEKKIPSVNKFIIISTAKK